jgi:hypothetical protein
MTTPLSTRKSSICRGLLLLIIASSPVCTPFARGQRGTISTDSGAQSVNASSRTPTFDVTLVKPAQDGPGEINFSPDGLQAMNSSAEDLLRVAYHVQNIDGLILGMPKWARTRHFDVQGKVVGPDAAKVRGLNIDQRRLMLQTLLQSDSSFRPISKPGMVQSMRSPSLPAVPNLSHQIKETAIRSVAVGEVI